MANMKCKYEDLMIMKNYLRANQVFIDMLYIIDMLEMKFQEKVDGKMTFEVLSKRAICLYYMVSILPNYMNL